MNFKKYHSSIFTAQISYFRLDPSGDTAKEYTSYYELADPPLKEGGVLNEGGGFK